MNFSCQLLFCIQNKDLWSCWVSAGVVAAGVLATPNRHVNNFLQICPVSPIDNFVNLLYLSHYAPSGGLVRFQANPQFLWITLWESIVEQALRPTS